MAHTYHNLLYHIVFGVKHRQSLLEKPIRDKVHAYMAGIVQHHDGFVIEINGIEDHVHVFAGLGTKFAVADIVRDIKASSSKWINEDRLIRGKFAWQTGYSIFSVSHSQRDKVAGYVRKQEEHHASQTFKEEYVKLLDKHGIPYDPKYVFEEEFAA